MAEAWILPDVVLEKFEDMSNSGGSWGPDGRLYLTGHDPAEAYVMQLPEAGSILQWVATVPLKNTGQGIAWDRSARDVIYGIIRGDTDADNRVTANRVRFPRRRPRSPRNRDLHAHRRFGLAGAPPIGALLTLRRRSAKSARDLAGSRAAMAI